VKKNKNWLDSVKAVSSGEHYLKDGYVAIKLMGVARGKHVSRIWYVIDTTHVTRNAKGIVKKAKALAQTLHVPYIPHLKNHAPIRRAESDQLRRYAALPR